MTNNTLLENILNDPDNDEKRLVYADWLMTQGDPRGEFIRIQCERINSNNNSNNEMLGRIEDELLKKYKRKWTKKYRAAKYANWTFSRGFVKSLAIRANYLVNLAEVIFTAEPVERLTVKAIDDDNLQAVLHCPHLSRLRELNLKNNKIGKSGIELLAKAENFINLRKLDIRFARVGVRCASSLEKLNSDSLPKLEELDLDSNKFGDKGLAGLLNSNLFKQLRRLKLRNCNIGPEGVNQLCHLGSNNMTHLSVEQNSIGSQGLEQIISTKNLPALNTLNVCGCSIDGKLKGLHGISLAGLRHLNLDDNYLESKSIIGLFLSSILGQLQTLQISSCDIGADAVTQLSQFETNHLQKLGLSDNPIGNRGMQEVFNGKGFDRLEELDVENCSIDEKLKCAHFLSTIKRLYIQYNEIRYAGIEALFKFPLTPNLIELNLNFCSLDDKAFRIFSQCQLQKLESLSICGNQFSARNAKELVNATGFDSLKKIWLSSGYVSESTDVDKEVAIILSERYDVID